jgi:TorA maturation chaperone TorD
VLACSAASLWVAEGLVLMAEQLAVARLGPGAESSRDAAVDPVDVMRARHWSLLATLLFRPPGQELLEQLSSLEADETPLGAARGMLAASAREANEAALAREFHDLFIGLGRGELLPYASYYLTGFLHEKPLAKVRADMERLGLARADGVGEPEDHIATLAEIMAGLLSGAFEAGAEEAPRFFARHIAPWAGTFFRDLETAEHARFYRAVGRLGRVFVEIEAEAATLPA